MIGDSVGVARALPTINLVRLARMSGDEMAIVYYTDIAGRASATSAERGPQPTAAAMLREIVK